jgi:hypothetical protein
VTISANRRCVSRFRSCVASDSSGGGTSLAGRPRVRAFDALEESSVGALGLTIRVDDHVLVTAFD